MTLDAAQGVEVVGLYVRDQDEALAFYVEKLGFRVHTDVRTPASATRRETGGR